MAGVLVAGATACVAFGPPQASNWPGFVLELLVIGAGIPLLWRRAETRAAFYAMLAALVVPAAMVIATGHLR